MTKQEVLQRFEAIQQVMLATTDGARAYVRPVMMVYHQNRFFIATGYEDAKCSQIAKVAAAEVCYYPDTKDKGCYVRINGRVRLVGEVSLKAEIMEVASYIKSYWSDPADPGYAVIEVIPDWFAVLEYQSNIETRIEN